MSGVSLIVAMSVPGRVIGKGGKLPWHLPEDLAFFKKTTTGHAIIMGRKTWDEVGRPLPKRRNIVVTRQPSLVLEGAEIATSVEAALAMARTTDPEPFVIGGTEIFRQAIPLASRIYLTEVRQDVEGDVHFPELGDEWEETERRAGETPGVMFLVLDRKTPRQT
ncbi:MAG: Dihydrofolate reductase [Myxococcaceae bacterium]|nr:Dihydrofolate reductase [Myxococcaceae bacterium]